jgi:hypothetical protein
MKSYLRKQSSALEAAAMKTQAIAITVPRRSIKHMYRGLAAAAVMGAGVGQIATAGGSDYFHDALLNPSEAVLLAEHLGRVTIFDGLDSRVVDRALDEQYERIDRMMFVRTRHVQQDGSVESDDDCD